MKKEKKEKKTTEAQQKINSKMPSNNQRLNGGAKGKEIKTEKKTPKKKQPQVEPTGKHLQINKDHKVKTYERYPFERMSIGDYFIEPQTDKDGEKSARNWSRRFGHRQNPIWKFSVRKTEQGYRVLRIQ